MPIILPGTPTQSEHERLDILLGLLDAEPRVYLRGLPDPGTPAPTYELVAPFFAVPPPPEEPAAWAVRFGLPSPGTQQPMRPWIAARAVRPPDGIAEDIPPRVASPRALPSAGTPTPVAVMPPGPLRVGLAAVEEMPARSVVPRILPSVGTPTLDHTPIAGRPLVVPAAEEPAVYRSWVPASTPGAGPPPPTGPGLLVPPDRIARGWAAGGWMGGGGMLGGVGGEHAGSIGGDNGLSPWGAGAASSDGAPFIEGGWASIGPNGINPLGGTAPIPPGGGGTGVFSLGVDCNCCSCKSVVCVVMCGTIPVYGATINALSGGTLVATCTTDATGCCNLGVSGTFTIQVVVGGSIAYQATRTLACNDTITIPLPSTNMVCCGGYAIPYNLTLTDDIGSLSFVYYPSYYYPIWYGGHSATQDSCPVATPGGICVSLPPSVGPVRVCYQMICYAGQDPTFTLQRAWSWVYQQGTLIPTWYQDPSGFTPGFPCATAPPASCGSPLTDTASGTANPSSTTPFTISFSLTPQSSNATSDPVGGGVVISA